MDRLGTTLPETEFNKRNMNNFRNVTKASKDLYNARNLTISLGKIIFRLATMAIPRIWLITLIPLVYTVHHYTTLRILCVSYRKENNMALNRIPIRSESVDLPSIFNQFLSIFL